MSKIDALTNFKFSGDPFSDISKYLEIARDRKSPGTPASSKSKEEVLGDVRNWRNALVETHSSPDEFLGREGTSIKLNAIDLVTAEISFLDKFYIHYGGLDPKENGRQSKSS